MASAAGLAPSSPPAQLWRLDVDSANFTLPPAVDPTTGTVRSRA